MKALFTRTFSFPFLVLVGLTLSTSVQAQTHVSHEGTTHSLKGGNHLIEGIEKYRLLVKFSPEMILDIESGVPLFSNLPTSAKSTLPFLKSFTYRQALLFTPSEKETLRKGTPPPPALGKFDSYAFRGLAYVEQAENLDKNAVLALANALEKIPFVEYASLEPFDPTPPPASPDFTDNQLYKLDRYTKQNNVYGIDAEYAWSIGITGQGVKVADIEWGWDYQHEDLVSANFIELVSATTHSEDNHGTAVAGIMIAKKNAFGMTGMVHGVDKYFGVSELRNSRAAGIAIGLKELDAGDVFLYEMQTGGQNGEYVPADYNKAVWDITKSATNAGIIVVGTAGNGGENLDDAFYKPYRDRGDNGTIMAGAGTKIGRNQASFSTYGSLVHVQGWGDWSVATTGYGALFNGGEHATYTNGFSGTSSAGPIVASAVVAVQSYSKLKRGITLTPKEMRKLLIETGTPQGTGGHVGPLPNIRRAIEALSTVTSLAEEKELVNHCSQSKPFPNPSTGKMILQNTADNIEVYDMYGHTQASFRYSKENQELDLSSLNNGMYMLHFVNKEERCIEKIIKQD